ncbi:MAG: family transporter [Proteobacteria bacterium]|nr:family transporter [Pseudomonadota bacterium]
MQSLWMIAASFLFACMGVCVKFAAQTHSAVEITFYRSFISLILMFGLVRLNGVPLATPHLRWQITRRPSSSRSTSVSPACNCARASWARWCSG